MKNTTIEAVADQHPEILVPDDLRPYYDAAYEAASKSASTPRDNPFWAKNVQRLATSVVAQNYDVVPGSVNRPPTVFFGSDEQLQEWQASYSASEKAEREYGAKFRAEVEALVTSILDDPFRELRLHFHLMALDAASEAKRRADDKVKNRETFEKANTCPVCRECDPVTNGHIKARVILSGATPVVGAVNTPAVIKSCLACWTDAHSQLTAALGAKRLDSLGRTRHQVVAAHLSVS